MRSYILKLLLLLAACSITVGVNCLSSAAADEGAVSGTPGGIGVHTACYLCHKSHLKLTPASGDCIQCHSLILKSGNHEVHVTASKMKCMDCHKPHIWRVSADKTRKACVRCHELKVPEGPASPRP